MGALNQTSVDVTLSGREIHKTSIVMFKRDWIWTWKTILLLAFGTRAVDYFADNFVTNGNAKGEGRRGSIGRGRGGESLRSR